MFLEDDAVSHEGSVRQAMTIARSASSEHFSPPGSVTKAALEVIRDRGGVTMSDKRGILKPENVELRLKSYYANTDGLKIVPRGESEPEGQIPIQLREAVILDTAEELKKDLGLRERNSTAIRRHSSEFYRQEENRGKFLSEFEFGITQTGELVDPQTGPDIDSVKARLAVDENGNVWRIDFVHPDYLTAKQMKSEVEGNPKHSEMMVLASVMEHNLKNAFERAQSKHTRPGASISNAGYHGEFESDKKLIRKPLWSAVKAEFPQYGLHTATSISTE